MRSERMSPTRIRAVSSAWRVRPAAHVVRQVAEALGDSQLVFDFFSRAEPPTLGRDKSKVISLQSYEHSLRTMFDARGERRTASFAIATSRPNCSSFGNDFVAAVRLPGQANRLQFEGTKLTYDPSTERIAFNPSHSLLKSH